MTAQEGERGGKGLKRDAIGLLDGLIIGIASTADPGVAAGLKAGVAAAVPEKAV